jgi:hypothetical protein
MPKGQELIKILKGFDWNIQIRQQGLTNTWGNRQKGSSKSDIIGNHFSIFYQGAFNGGGAEVEAGVGGSPGVGTVRVRQRGGSVQRR